MTIFGWAQPGNAIPTYQLNAEHEYEAPADTSIISIKKFEAKAIDRLIIDPELNYKQPPTIAESLWDRILYWIGRFFQALFRGATLDNIGRILTYTLGIVLIIALIFMLLKVNAFRVFYSGADQGSQSYQVFHENIHEMDFELLIKKAVEDKDYRQGTRLLLLYSLKMLSDKHLIQWEAGKTNHDYVNELSANELKTGLNEISFYFDYAWYGNFPIDSEVFNKVQITFSDWRKKLPEV